MHIASDQLVTGPMSPPAVSNARITHTPWALWLLKPAVLDTVSSGRQVPVNGAPADVMLVMAFAALSLNMTPRKLTPPEPLPLVRSRSTPLGLESRSVTSPTKV